MELYKMDEETIKKLEDIKKDIDLRRREGVIDNYCREASEVVRRELNFSTVQGEFYGEKDIYAHMWNRGPDGEIVDLTGKQFDKNIPNVYITKDDSRYVVT